VIPPLEVVLLTENETASANALPQVGGNAARSFVLQFPVDESGAAQGLFGAQLGSPLNQAFNSLTPLLTEYTTSAQFWLVIQKLDTGGLNAVPLIYITTEFGTPETQIVPAGTLIMLQAGVPRQLRPLAESDITTLPVQIIEWNTTQRINIEAELGYRAQFVGLPPENSLVAVQLDATQHIASLLGEPAVSFLTSRVVARSTGLNIRTALTSDDPNNVVGSIQPDVAIDLIIPKDVSANVLGGIEPNLEKLLTENRVSAFAIDNTLWYFAMHGGRPGWFSTVAATPDYTGTAQATMPIVVPLPQTLVG
jgi:hypothetical protein